MSMPEQNPPQDNKLSRIKRRWAAEGRGLVGLAKEPTPARLPPGQHFVRDWPVLDLGEQLEVSLEQWTLRVSGLVEASVVWDWSMFQAAPQVEVVADIHCVTTWPRYDNRFMGVSTQTLLDAVRPEADAHFIMLYSSDGYSTNLPLADFAAPGALLVRAGKDSRFRGSIGVQSG